MNVLLFVVPALILGVWLTLRPSAATMARGPEDRDRRIRRAVLFVFAWVSILAAAVWHSHGSDGSAVVLSDGTTEAMVLALESRQPGAVLALDGNDWSDSLPVAESRSDLAVWLEETVEGGEPIEILGWGLHGWDWDRLSVLPGRFEPPEDPTGLIEVAWPPAVTLGSRLEVTGRVRLKAPSRVRLLGPGGEEVAVALAAGESSRGFRLSLTPKTTGRLLYILEIEIPGHESVPREIPLWVEDPRPPAVLWIEAAPSFESREVRNWLTSLGNPIAVGAHITRGRTRWQQANFDPPLALGGPLTRHLDRLDLVVVDPESWRQLPRSDRTAIETAIRETGLGLLMLTGGVDLQSLRDLPIRGLLPEAAEPSSAVAVPRRLHLSWSGSGDAVPPLDGPHQGWQIDETVRPLVIDASNSALVAWQPFGRGRAAASRLTETHAWVRTGEEKVHRSYWSQLVAEVARPVAAERWNWRPGPVLVDQPFEVWLETVPDQTDPPIPAVVLDEPSGRRSRLAPHQELEGWRFRLHPKEVGWHRLGSARGEAWFFASPTEDWMDWDRAQRYEATLALATRTIPSRGRSHRLPRWLLWGVGIFLLTWVWVDERIGPLRGG